MSRRYLFYRDDIPKFATFQAACFVREEEAKDPWLQGTALAAYLGEQLQERGVPVGEVQVVYFGLCYYRCVQIGGKELGLAVNALEDAPGWWLRIDRPVQGGTAEVEELYRLLEDILRGVEGLHSLEWQTEAEWHKRAEVPKRPRPGVEP
jgi:hypothetical protein